MSNFVIAIIVSASVFAWSYNKFIGRTGGDSQRAITTAAMLAGMAFLVMLIILSIVTKTTS